MDMPNDIKILHTICDKISEMSITKQKLTERRESKQFLPPPIEAEVSLLAI